jgi:Domain of unknown function (DUF4388)
MQNNRFVVLTGHLSNYPLSDLVGILRHQKKTGRLLIEYPKGPATFFFQEGELIDARLNDLVGLQAICVALAQPDAAFNFNPFIPATRRSIEPSLQRAVSELFGCWDESALQIETTVATAPVLTTQPEPLALPPREPLALPPAPPSAMRQRPLLFMAAAVLTGVGLSTVIAVTGGFKANPPAAAAAESAARPATRSNPPSPSAVVEKPEPTRQATAKVNRRAVTSAPKAEPQSEPPVTTDQKQQSISVVMQIENGRVLKASIANPKPGRESYEALALRIARQRRYAPTTSGGQTVTIAVTPKD